MLSGLYKIGSRLMFETDRQEQIARNLAGAGVSGFKGTHVTARTFRQELGERGQVAYGVDASTPNLDLGQGGLARTGRALDFALSGSGFFQVQTPDGANLLTRNGAFAVSPAGTLVTQEGYAVLGEGGPIRLDVADDTAKFEVTEKGEILAPAPDGKTMRQVGVLALGTVANPDDMARVSASYFLPGKDQAVLPAADARVCNGYQEQANVSPIQEMAAMIQSLREFEAGQRMLKTLIELSQDENQKLS